MGALPWLAACWFDLGIVLGALAWLWIHRLTGGTWGEVLRPHALRLGSGPVAVGSALVQAKDTYLSGKVAAAFGDGIFLAIWDSLYGSKTGKRFESFEPSTGDYSSEWNYSPDAKRFSTVDNTRFGVNIIVYALTR